MYPYNPYYHPTHYSPLTRQLPQSYPYLPYTYRPLPEVNPSLFMSSAQSMRLIMKDASKLLDQMADSRKFSLDLMTAAQNSDQQEVNTMLKNTGIQIVPKVSYTPDGLKLQFSSYVEELDCCHLTLSLRWM